MFLIPLFFPHKRTLALLYTRGTRIRNRRKKKRETRYESRGKIVDFVKSCDFTSICGWFYSYRGGGGVGGGGEEGACGHMAAVVSMVFAAVALEKMAQAVPEGIQKNTFRHRKCVRRVIFQDVDVRG